MLREADSNAKERNVSNVDWMDAGCLGEVRGRYDLVISMFVFQHVPVQQGVRLLATIFEGLRPGGAGCINLLLRPSPAHLLAGSLPAMWRAPGGYPYMLRSSYSLNRVGRLLADAGVTTWHARFWPEVTKHFDAVDVIFRKD